MRKKAFTLVELLVVMAIIGILIALLLPAVQMVRESARRTACMNNIRQIAVGLHNYETGNAHFPSGWQGNVSASEVGWAWMAQTLPFVEQQNVHRLIALDKNVLDASNASVIAFPMNSLMCPSSTMDTTSFMLETTDAPLGAGSIEIGRSHYVGCIGSAVEMETMDDGQTCPSLSLLTGDSFVDGMFYKNSSTPLRDVLDGTSTTILIGERSGELFDSIWPGVVKGSTFTGWRVIGWTGEPPNNPAAPPQTVINESGDEEEMEVHFHGFAQFNSMHAGEVTSFAFVDGSTHAISSSINAGTFKAMGTIRGRERIADY